MASKLCLLLLATSLALILTTNASILRTTVSEIEEENPSQGSCSTQMRLNLTPCLNWIKHSGTGFEGDWEMPRTSGSQQYKQQCCNMMEKMDEDCMCSALKKTVRDKCMSGGRSFQGQGGMCSERMTEKLMSVPMMCGFMNEKCPYTMLLV